MNGLSHAAVDHRRGTPENSVACLNAHESGDTSAVSAEMNVKNTTLPGRWMTVSLWTMMTHCGRRSFLTQVDSHSQQLDIVEFRSPQTSTRITDIGQEGIESEG